VSSACQHLLRFRARLLHRRKPAAIVVSATAIPTEAEPASAEQANDEVAAHVDKSGDASSSAEPRRKRRRGRVVEDVGCVQQSSAGRNSTGVKE
jgi:hypothetical protein